MTGGCRGNLSLATRAGERTHKSVLSPAAALAIAADLLFCKPSLNRTPGGLGLSARFGRHARPGDEVGELLDAGLTVARLALMFIARNKQLSAVGEIHGGKPFQSRGLGWGQRERGDRDAELTLGRAFINVLTARPGTVRERETHRAYRNRNSRRQPDAPGSHGL